MVINTSEDVEMVTVTLVTTPTTFQKRAFH